MTSIERMIRSEFPGNANATLRKRIRAASEVGHEAVEKLSTWVSGDQATLAALARIAAELKRSKEEDKRVKAAQEEAQEALRTNCCPVCKRPVRRNNSMTGWVQCSQFGDGHFRADPNVPKCGWQGFTRYV